MQFAEAQIYGRTGERCISTLRDAATGRGSKLTDKDVFFLRLLSQFLRSDVPRLVRSENTPHCVIITDACFEREAKSWQCGVGGLFLHPLKNTLEFFSKCLDFEQMQLLGFSHKHQIVFEAETLCAVLAFAIWRKHCNSRRLFIYVDNEGTKYSLIKCRSQNACVDALSMVFAEMEAESDCISWISRVSSYSNAADAPSRGDTAVLTSLGAKDISEQVAEHLGDILSSMVSKMGHKDG